MKRVAFAKDGSDRMAHPQRDFPYPQRDVAYPLTPQQYYDQFSRAERLDGEWRLLFAVLEDAVRCYTTAARSNRGADRRALEEVKRWVEARGDRDLFSFDSICRVLDLEPDRLRRQLASIETMKIPMRRFRTVGRRTAISAEVRKRRSARKPGRSL
jgi:hypothetical protein